MGCPCSARTDMAGHRASERWESGGRGGEEGRLRRRLAQRQSRRPRAAPRAVIPDAGPGAGMRPPEPPGAAPLPCLHWRVPPFERAWAPLASAIDSPAPPEDRLPRTWTAAGAG